MRLFYLVFIAASCVNSEQSSIEQINAEKVAQLVENGVTVVDIRTSKEYQNGHIPGVLHFDFTSDSFLKNMESLDKSEPMIIHCASGGRSARAAKQLQEAGFIKIYDYSGGFKNWNTRGLDIEK